MLGGLSRLHQQCWIQSSCPESIELGANFIIARRIAAKSGLLIRRLRLHAARPGVNDGLNQGG